MTLTNSEVVSTLDGLIETCRDGEIGYRDAAEGVVTAHLKDVFHQYSMQRTRDISDLQNEVRNFGGEPQKGGSLAGAVHRGWLNLKAAITGKDEETILAECERGEDVAVKTYEDALKKDLPASVHGIVEYQFTGVKEAHNRIRTSRDEMKNNKK